MYLPTVRYWVLYCTAYLPTAYCLVLRTILMPGKTVGAGNKVGPESKVGLENEVGPIEQGGAYYY